VVEALVIWTLLPQAVVGEAMEVILQEVMVLLGFVILMMFAIDLAGDQPVALKPLVGLTGIITQAKQYLQASWDKVATLQEGLVVEALEEEVVAATGEALVIAITVQVEEDPAMRMSYISGISLFIQAE
jgi:hypothetical protein